MAGIYKKDGKGPYIIAYFDHTGRRREKSSGTTDHAAAERIAKKLDADAALRRERIVDARHDRFAAENRRPIPMYVAEYEKHCRHVGQADRHVVQKIRHLQELVDTTDVSRLSDLTVDSVEGYLRSVRDRGLSARTTNARRQSIVAFVSWCKRTGRAESNLLGAIPKLDEERDRRRVRRPLTEDELSRLLSVAETRGRREWYLTAALAGLRRSELRKLCWSDLDFDAGTIAIRDGKARREDLIPMHPQLADELARIRPAKAYAKARVFPTEVTNETRLKDFLRAGLARRMVVTDAGDKPVLIGTGKRQRPKTRIVTEDEDGRVVDLHALRTTLGTQLARSGIAPQIAQRIMRHAEYKTTLKHYTVLGLTDTASAIRQLPRIDSPATKERDAATGTYDADPHEKARPGHPQQNPQQSECFSQLRGATGYDNDARRHLAAPKAQVIASARVSDDLRSSATACHTAGERTRTVNVQLGRLMLYH